MKFTHLRNQEINMVDISKKNQLQEVQLQFHMLDLLKNHLRN